MIAWFTTFIAFTVVITLVQFGMVAVLFLIGALSIVFAAILSLVVYLITIGRGIFSERKYGARF